MGEDGEKENGHEQGDRVEAVVAAAVDCHFQHGYGLRLIITYDS